MFFLIGLEKTCNVSKWFRFVRKKLRVFFLSGLERTWLYTNSKKKRSKSAGKILEGQSTAV